MLPLDSDEDLSVGVDADLAQWKRQTDQPASAQPKVLHDKFCHSYNDV